MEYDVALSFAGEDREYVEAVAYELKRLSVKVFYDNFETANLWGKDLYTHLQNVYEKQAKYTVIFISEYYAKKLWTNHERKMAQARAFTESREYILPARFDDTEIEGITSTTGYIDLRKFSSIEFANLVFEKLNLSELNSLNVHPEVLPPESNEVLQIINLPIEKVMHFITDDYKSDYIYNKELEIRDFSKLDLKFKILLALGGLTLERIVAGNEKMAEEHFTAVEIHSWFAKRPQLGTYNIRILRKELDNMRQSYQDILDDAGNLCGTKNIISSFLGKKRIFYYKIPSHCVRTPLSAKLILKLIESRKAKPSISLNDEKRVISEIYNAFKFDPLYKLSSEEDVTGMVQEAVKGLYFTRGADKRLRTTTRCFRESEYLQLLSNL